MTTLNMIALARRSGALERALSACPQSPAYTMQQAKNGNATVAYNDAKGNPRFLHSRYDPIKEAEKLAAQYYSEEVRYFFLIGFGLGYQGVRLFEKLNTEQRLIIIEPDQSLLRDACRIQDLQALLSDERVFLVSSPNVHVCHEKIKTVLHTVFPYSSEAINYRIIRFYDRWEKYNEFLQLSKKMIEETVTVVNGVRKTIFQLIDTLRLNGLGKQCLGDYKECLEFLRVRLQDKKGITSSEIGLLATYFLFSHYSYSETFEKGEAVEQCPAVTEEKDCTYPSSPNGYAGAG